MELEGTVESGRVVYLHTYTYIHYYPSLKAKRDHSTFTFLVHGLVYSIVSLLRIAIVSCRMFLAFATIIEFLLFLSFSFFF